MDLFSTYLLQTLPVQRAAGSHAGTRAHAGACTSARPETSDASPDGPAHGRWPERIATRESCRESLCAFFVPSCLCGWPWLPGYNYQLIVLETDIISQNPAPGKLPCQKLAHLARPAPQAAKPTPARAPRGGSAGISIVDHITQRSSIAAHAAG